MGLLAASVVVGFVRLVIGLNEPVGTLVNVVWAMFDLTVMSVLVTALRYTPGRGPPMRFTTEYGPAYTCVHGAGRPNMGGAPTLRDTVAEVIAGGATHVVLDLGGTEFADSSGLGLAVIQALVNRVVFERHGDRKVWKLCRGCGGDGPQSLAAAPGSLDRRSLQPCGRPREADTTGADVPRFASVNCRSACLDCCSRPPIRGSRRHHEHPAGEPAQLSVAGGTGGGTQTRAGWEKPS